MADMKKVWIERLKETGINLEDLKTKAIKEIVKNTQIENKEVLAKFLWKLSIYLHTQNEELEKEMEKLYHQIKGG